MLHAIYAKHAVSQRRQRFSLRWRATWSREAPLLAMLKASRRGPTPGGCTPLVPLPAAGAAGGGGLPNTRRCVSGCGAASAAAPLHAGRICRRGRRWHGLLGRGQRRRGGSGGPDGRGHRARCRGGGWALFAGHVEVGAQLVGSGAHRVGELWRSIRLRRPRVSRDRLARRWRGRAAAARTAPPARGAAGLAPGSWIACWRLPRVRSRGWRRPPCARLRACARTRSWRS